MDFYANLSKEQQVPHRYAISQLGGALFLDNGQLTHTHSGFIVLDAANREEHCSTNFFKAGSAGGRLTAVGRGREDRKKAAQKIKKKMGHPLLNLPWGRPGSNLQVNVPSLGVGRDASIYDP